MTTDQALQLAIAESEFPDLMRNISFATMAELAAAAKLLPLDKYFNDPENYPIFAEADIQELLKFRVNGVLYGIPGFGWRIRHDDPAWVWPMWCMRLDVYKEYGYPKTSEELLATMRKVKGNEKFLDLDGNPVIPLGLHGGHALQMLGQTLSQFKGAGFQVDPQKRLMPEWASEQIYEAIKYFNLMWREQQRWLEWMKSNNIDDRAELKTVDPVREWKAVTGW